MLHTPRLCAATKGDGFHQRCRPTVASPTGIPQHGLGCCECHCLGNYFIFSHVREKPRTPKNWSQSDPGCCHYSQVKLQLQEGGIVMVVSAAEGACHKKSVCDN